MLSWFPVEFEERKKIWREELHNDFAYQFYYTTNSKFPNTK